MGVPEQAVRLPGVATERQRPAATGKVVEQVARAADGLIDHLVVHERVDVFFGLPGGAISPLHDALYRRNDVRVITNRHEADAVYAAAGYAQATGKIGVALVTSGPGLLNAINAMASAHLEGLPVLVLAGEAPRARFGHGALQEGSAYGLDLVHMVRPITKAALQLHDASAVSFQLVSVLKAMKQGRPGCGLITCPVDVTQAPGVPVQVGVGRERSPLPDEGAFDRVARLLAAAKRPLLYAGNGVRRGDGPAALRALAERCQAPVITTPHGKGIFPDSHPLALGVFGWGAHPSATAYLQSGVDCVVAIGTSLSEVSSNSWSPLLQGRGAFVQIDVDPERIGRSYRVDVAIVAEAASALRSIAVRAHPVARRQFGVARLTDPTATRVGPNHLITPQRALWELQRVTPADTCFVSDLGEHMRYAFHYLHIDDPRTFMIHLGLCSMGSGIGAGVGVAATRERPVAIITGDGCLAMQLGPLETAARERLPVVFAVLNNQRLDMCEVGHESVYGCRPDYSTTMDIVQVAEGLGLPAVRITSPDELLALGPLELLDRGPLVLDILIDPDERMPANPRDEVLRAKPKIVGRV